MFADVDYLPWAAFEKMTMETGRLAEKGSLLFVSKIGFVWNRKITVCPSVVNSVLITSEYCTITYSRFDTKVNIIDMF